MFGNRKKGDQTFIGHLDAFRSHLLRMSIALVIGAIVTFVFIEDIFEIVILAPTRIDFPPYVWLCNFAHAIGNPDLCMEEIPMRFQSAKLSAQFMMSITASLVFGFIAAFPYLVYELWQFLKPALSPRELKMSRGMIFWVSLLFLLGVLFGYYIITPYTVNFFASYTISPRFENIFKIDDYVSTVISIALGTGLIFELPVMVFFLSKIGLVNPRFMREYRKYAIIIVLVLAAVITPPDMISQIIVAIPIMILYEISIRISARVEKNQIAAEKKLLDKYNS